MGISVWQLLIILTMVLLVFLFIKTVVGSSKNQNLAPKKGLGGWLIFVGFGVLLSPFFLMFQLYSQFNWEDGTWKLLTTPGTEYFISGFAPLIIFEGIYNSLYLLLSFVLIFLFFKKHYLFPKLYIISLIVPLLVVPIDSILASRIMDLEVFDSETSLNLFKSALGALIWIPYILNSKRVKLTFVEGRKDLKKIQEDYRETSNLNEKSEDLLHSHEDQSITTNTEVSSPFQDKKHDIAHSDGHTENQQPLAPDTQLQYFKILKYLARGGFGITYLALDTKRNRPVVIKEYFPSVSAFRNGQDSTVSLLSTSHNNDYQEGLRRFQREAVTLSDFTHSNIVEVIAFFEANNTAYFVMEFVEGESLQDKLDAKNGQPFSEAEIQRDFLPILKGLKQIHSIDLLHLDIKPENILHTKYGEPLLIDFGGARFATGQASHDHSSMVATAGYAPPEQYSLSQDQTPASDIYAFGMTLYKLMAPKEDLPDSKDRQNALLEDVPDPLKPIREVAKGYSDTLYKIVEACTQVKKSARPKSVTSIEALMIDYQPESGHNEVQIERTPVERQERPDNQSAREKELSTVSEALNTANHNKVTLTNVDTSNSVYMPLILVYLGVAVVCLYLWNNTNNSESHERENISLEEAEQASQPKKTDIEYIWNYKDWKLTVNKREKRYSFTTIAQTNSGLGFSTDLGKCNRSVGYLVVSGVQKDIQLRQAITFNVLIDGQFIKKLKGYVYKKSDSSVWISFPDLLTASKESFKKGHKLRFDPISPASAASELSKVDLEYSLFGFTATYLKAHEMCQDGVL